MVTKAKMQQTSLVLIVTTVVLVLPNISNIFS
jgi:hypothetical protein